MKASEEITEEQSRQVRSSSCLPLLLLTRRIKLLFDVDHAYAEFFRSLGGKDEAR
jgi:ESCRT-I complex subunit VPS28